MTAEGPSPAVLAASHAVAAPPARLRVVVIGDRADSNVCDVYRTRMFQEPLRALGIDVRYLNAGLDRERPLGIADVEHQIADGVERLWAGLQEADVAVFRRGYGTHAVCGTCGWATLELRAAARHGTETGHVIDIGANAAVRPLFERLERDAQIAGRLGILYETDDDLLQMEASNGHYRAMRHEMPLLERMIRRADLVTVSTPVLAVSMGQLADNVLVVRNAVDPAWYGSHEDGRPGSIQSSRIVYYGSLPRLRDYRAVAPAVDAVARRTGMVRSWIGAPSLSSAVERARAMFDEVHPFVVGVPAFARALSDLSPSIGLAPLSDDRYARGRSELHWLEYTMAGAATMASWMPGGGPYDPIRHRRDGILVGSRSGWRRELERLAASTALREELAGNARERVLAEYTVGVRTLEWAAAYRAVAAAAGRGLRTAASACVARPPHAPRRPVKEPEPRRELGAAAAGGPPARGLAAPLVSSLFGAYVAAQSFAACHPLRLRLGVAGSSARVADPGREWVTIDSGGQPDIRHDVGLGLPFGDGTVEAIDADGVVDHVGSCASILAAEAFRVLCSGGVLQVSVADRTAALARRGEVEALPAYTVVSLDGLLRSAGFVDVTVARGAGSELVATATR